MSNEEPDPIEDWEAAEEHGDALGRFISEQDRFAHEDDLLRNEDGSYRRRTLPNRNDE